MNALEIVIKGIAPWAVSPNGQNFKTRANAPEKPCGLLAILPPAGISHFPITRKQCHSEGISAW